MNVKVKKESFNIELCRMSKIKRNFFPFFFLTPLMVMPHFKGWLYRFYTSLQHYSLGQSHILQWFSIQGVELQMSYEFNGHKQNTNMFSSAQI
jgi:hypothetical protein